MRSIASVCGGVSPRRTSMPSHSGRNCATISTSTRRSVSVVPRGRPAVPAAQAGIEASPRLQRQRVVVPDQERGQRLMPRTGLARRGNHLDRKSLRDEAGGKIAADERLVGEYRREEVAVADHAQQHGVVQQSAAACAAPASRVAPNAISLACIES
jgi:hypothetical protein